MTNPYSPQNEPPPVVSPEQRSYNLANAVNSLIAQGYRVESQAPGVSAMLVIGSKPNHMLHLILTVLTCFVWSFVWLFVALLQKEHRTSLDVDPYGRINRQDLS